MAMSGSPFFGVNLAIARYGWYGVGTRMGSIFFVVCGVDGEDGSA